MKKQPKIAQPQKANETSFKPGNKEAEKWTKDIAESFLLQALELSKTEITLTNIANTLDTYPDVFEFIVNKFPDFRTIKSRIEKHIENNTYQKALHSEINATVAIFGLKNNHGWKDKTEVEQTTKVSYMNKPPLEFFDSETETD
jgi:hypothetical protein